MGGDFNYRERITNQILTTTGLSEDIDASVDTGQTAKRKFREIARIAGMVPQKYPGKDRKGGRAVHVSSSLLFSTLERFDPENLLVTQAKTAAANELSGSGRLPELMNSLAAGDWCWSDIHRPSPLSFPLIIERVRARIGSESLAERVANMQRSWKEMSKNRRKNQVNHDDRA